MSVSACRRSWIVLPVVGVLLGALASPLALCDIRGGQVRCAAGVPRQAESLDRCHESEALSPASMTCCGDRDARIMPLTLTTLTDLAGAPLATTASPVDPVIGDEPPQGPIEGTVLTRHRPLFTLFSTFLI